MSAFSRSPRTRRRLVATRLLALALLASLAPSRARADDPTSDKPSAPASENVTLTTEDGATIAATYFPASPGSYPAPVKTPGGAPAAGSKTPALVLVHGEASSKLTWLPLLPKLAEYHLSALAIDLRGFGASEAQGAKHLGPAATKRDPDLFTAMHQEVRAAVQWLVKTKGHDPARIAGIGAGLGADVLLDAARRNPEDWNGVMLMTPLLDCPGMMVEDWMKTMVGPVAGAVRIIILSSVEDGDKGPRKLLYTLEYARDAPPKTPSALKEEKRRGVYPRTRFLPETGATGTGMFGHVKQIEQWIAAWFARDWGTYPNVILFDGAVEDKYDLRDPSWANGVSLPVGKFTGHALRWGRRLMFGSEGPMDVKYVRLRVHASRGETEIGEYAEIDVPNASMRTDPIQHTGARHPPIDNQHLVLQGDPGGDGIDAQNPSFEVEMRFPSLPGSGAMEYRVSWGYITANGTEVNTPGVDPLKPETWAPVPDSDEIPPAIPK